MLFESFLGWPVPQIQSYKNILIISAKLVMNVIHNVNVIHKGSCIAHTSIA